MKKFILFLFSLLLPFVASAQGLRFAYFSYEEVLLSLPEYAAVQREMATLRDKYEAETRRSEEDFNAKYEEFLEGQRDFAPSIFRKRQAELQEMVEKNTAFKKEAERLLSQAEREAMTPIRKRIDDAIGKLGSEGGYAFVLNSDNGAVPYIDSSCATDITANLKAALH